MTPLAWIKIAYNSSQNWKDILPDLLHISHVTALNQGILPCLADP